MDGLEDLKLGTTRYVGTGCSVARRTNARRREHSLVVERELRRLRGAGVPGYAGAISLRAGATRNARIGSSADASMRVTSLALVGCGLLLLMEAAIGQFWPGVYRLVAAPSQGRSALRLIGGSLFLCGVVCLAVALPPREGAQWFLVAAGGAMVVKGTLLMAFLGALKDNPTSIKADPFRWKVKCGLRAAIGVALVLWAMVREWPSG